MGGGPAIIAKAQPVPKSVDSNLTEDMLDSNKGVALSDQANYVNPIDETAVHGDVGVTATKGIIGFVISEESTGSHWATPHTNVADEASPPSSPSDENMAKSNDNLPSYHVMGGEEEQDNQKTLCHYCHRSMEVDVLTTFKQPTALIAESHPVQRIPPNQRKRWPELWGESSLYSQPPWHYGRRSRVPFKEWMFYDPYTRPITLNHLVDEVKGIYAGYVKLEQKCIEVDAAQSSRQKVHEMDVIPFLDAIPSSVLIQLQRGKVDPEDIIRNSLESSLKRIKDTMEQWDGWVFYQILRHLHQTLATRIRQYYLHVPTLEECLCGFVFVLKARAKESGSHEFSVETTIDGNCAKMAPTRDALTVGHNLLQTVDKATEQAKRNIAQQAEEARAQEAKRRVEERQMKDSCIPLPLLGDSRPLSDAGRYKKIGEIYYMSVNGRWMDVSFTNEQYQALRVLHRTSMHEMYDFFLASSHPKASVALRRLSAKYDMPGRLWRHSIHDFLEVLRFRLPESLEHMNAGIIQSYSIMQLLEETTCFGDFTAECAGDLARYRFAIEDEDAEVGLHWKEVATQQYNRVVDSEATVGRLYHQLSILSGDNYLESFFNILKALAVSKPFCSAWETMVSTILLKFVAPECQISTELLETLSLVEDNLYTIIARLLLAAAPPVDLQKSCFDTCKETHLLAFDTQLRFVTEEDSLPSSIGPDGWDTKRPKRLFQSHTVRPSPELGLILCQLLFLDKNLAIADRAAQLLSAVNLHILIRPATQNLKLWQYLHVLLVVMRSLNTRADLIERFGYAFHPELMTPLLNILLRRLKNRGGDAWEALFRQEFPISWVPLNPKNKPDKYGMTTADAQREYFARKQKYEVETSIANDTKTEAPSTKAFNVDITRTTDGTNIAVVNGNGALKTMTRGAEDSTYVRTKISTERPENKVESGDIKHDSFGLGINDIRVSQTDDSKKEAYIAQPSLQTNAGVADHGPEDSLAIVQGAADHDIVSESHIGSEGSAVEPLYTIVLPEDRLLRGLSFANEAPSPPEPEHPPSEKQIARKKFEKEEIRIARLKEDKANQRAKRQEKRANHKEQRRVARGVDSQFQERTCTDGRTLAKRSGSRRYKKVSALEDNAKVSQECCQRWFGRRHVETPVVEGSENTEGSPKTKPDTVLEAVEKTSVDDEAAIPIDDSGSNTRQANKSTADVSAKSIQSAELISDVEHTAEAIVTDDIDASSQEPEYHNAHANEFATEDPPDLTILFHVADEDASQAVYITNPANADATTSCEEAGKANPTEKLNHPTIAEPENDYDISDISVQPGVEADNAEMKAQEAREKAQKEEGVLSLDPYFYPPRFFKSSKLDWEDFLACRDYVEDSEIMDNRELRMLWTATSKNSFFHLQMDENGGCIIGVPGGKPVPLPYFDAQIPAVITRDNGSRVIYVDPTVEKIVAEQDCLWLQHAEGKQAKERKRREEGKRQQVAETKEPKAAQDKVVNKSKEMQAKTQTGLYFHTQGYSLGSFRSSQLPCTPVQGSESVQGFNTDQTVKMDPREAENALEKPETIRLELEATEEVRSMQNVEAVGGEWCIVLGESPKGAVKEVGPATTTQDSSNKALNIPGPGAGVARSTYGTVAAMSGQDEEDMAVSVMKHQPLKSTERWVEAQGADGNGTTERVNDDDENSDGWTELVC